MTKPPEHFSAFVDLVDTAKAVKAASGRRDFNILHTVILAHLVIDPGATPGAICAELGLESGHGAKTLSGLTDDGLIASVPDEKDKRVKHFYLTPQGWEIAKGFLQRRGLPVPSDDQVRIAVPRRVTLRGGE